MSAKSRFLMIVAVVVLLGVVALAATAIYAGGFGFLGGAIDFVGRACSSGCTIA